MRHPPEALPREPWRLRWLRWRLERAMRRMDKCPEMSARWYLARSDAERLAEKITSLRRA